MQDVCITFVAECRRFKLTGFRFFLTDSEGVGRTASSSLKKSITLMMTNARMLKNLSNRNKDFEYYTRMQFNLRSGEMLLTRELLDAPDDG